MLCRSYLFVFFTSMSTSGRNWWLNGFHPSISPEAVCKFYNSSKSGFSSHPLSPPQDIKSECPHNCQLSWVIKISVTNYYLVRKLSTSLNLSSYLVSSGSKSLSISGGDSSYSWVLVHALGLVVKEDFKSVMLGGGWRCGELLVSSSTFAVIQRIHKSVPPWKYPHWKNTNTQLQYSLYCYS